MGGFIFLYPFYEYVAFLFPYFDGIFMVFVHVGAGCMLLPCQVQVCPIKYLQAKWFVFLLIVSFEGLASF